MRVSSGGLYGRTGEPENRFRKCFEEKLYMYVDNLVGVFEGGAL